MNKKYVMWVFGVDSGMVVDMLEEEGKVSLFIYIFFKVCVEFVYFRYRYNDRFLKKYNMKIFF